MKKIPVFLFFTTIAFTHCGNEQTVKQSKPAAPADTAQVQNTTKTAWLDSFDLDGDGVNDKIDFDFTGGAHCCYKLMIVLSSDKKQVKFPFEMDGGYAGQIDNSQPEQFDIKDIDNDNLPEILMRIETYNGKPNAIPKQWQTAYGIKSNYIVIEYKNKQLTVSDFATKMQGLGK